MVVVINAGKIIGKQYYIGGNQPVPKWLTEPTLENDSWTNPDVEQLINGQGDIYLIQEAVGFEDGGAIANRLMQHSMKTAYFQKGSAPPLAVVAKGPLAEDLTINGEAAHRVSGMRPDPANEIALTILACDTIPWGGVKDFYTHIPHDDLLRQQRTAPSSDDSSSNASSNEDEQPPPGQWQDRRNPNGEPDEEPKTEGNPNWALTWMTVKISFGNVTLHNNESQRTLPVGRFFNPETKRF